MSTKTHTPGPWEYHNSGFCDVVYTRGEKLGDGDRICEMYGPNTEANARLIAAAPELLEACKAVFAALMKEAEKDGTTIWIGPPHQFSWVHETAPERLATVIEQATGINLMTDHA